MQDLSGRKLGQYELRERLGRGGMAEVYKSYQSGMDRFVAVKVMLAGLNKDESFVERFRREARAVGNLRHPHIVQAFDFGVEDGIYYLAMEYITGGNLKAHIEKRGKLSLQDALRIATQLADALAFAHEKGMVHRDMKPANVMFLDDTLKHAILTDFGIARIMGEAALTGTGMAVGTPDYMSPEAGRGESTDHRSDIYALGIILYEMLVGDVPYSADTPLAVIMKHINAPLPTRHDHNDIIPEFIETVILRCMAKNVEDRFQTAQELKVALDKANAQLESSASTVAQSTAPKPGTAVSPSRQTVPTMIGDKDTPTEAVSAGQMLSAKPPAPGNALMMGVGGITVVALIALIAFFAMNGSDDMPEPTTAPEIAADVTEDAPTLAPTEMPTDEPTIAPTEAPEAQAVGEVILPPHPDNLKLLTGEITLVDSIAELLLNGNPRRARTNLDTMLSRGNAQVEALFARSQLASATGDFAQAHEDADNLIRLIPNRLLGYVALADVNVAEGTDFEVGLEAIETAATLAPNNPQILWRQAQLMQLTSRRPDDLQALFDAAEATGASGWRYILFAAKYLYNQGLYGRAIPYLEVVVNAIPDTFHADVDYAAMLNDSRSQLGLTEVASVDTGNSGEDETIEIPYEAQMPPLPDNLDLASGIAPIVDEIEILLITDGQEAALEAANEALEEDPDNVEALFARSLAYSCCWDADNLALADANRTVELDPENALGYIAQGHAYLNNGDYDAARAAIEQAHELDPNSSHVMWRYAGFSDYDVQLEHFDEAEASGATGWQFITLAANLLFDTREYDRAIPYLYVFSTQELDGSYGYWDARWKLMASLIVTDQSAAAYEFANQFMDNYESAEDYANIAYVAYRAGEYEQARTWANTAVALDGDAHAARYVLALIAWYEDENLDAAMEQLAALDGVDVYSFFVNFDFQHDVNLDRARILVDAGDLEAALPYYDAVISYWSYVDWLYEERADLHLELGNTEAARADLESARQITEDADYRRSLLQRIIDLGAAPTSTPED